MSDGQAPTVPVHVFQGVTGRWQGFKNLWREQERLDSEK